jgi:hypothetical protein
MAKKELNFGKLALPEKPVVVKKENTETVVEKAVETIHPTTVATLPPVAPVAAVIAPTPTPSVPVTETEVFDTPRLKKVSLDLPAEMYQFIKLHTFKRMITMREYMLELIHEDMKRKGEA